ncbi:MAG: S-layer homology domain-containing protein, partial [Oscillibacter sp.]|nr:S-layer homology domain-containing protein [Oscillibacter sp.]
YYYTYEGRLNGELNPTIYSSILKEATSPRTAVGMRNDGSLVFYTVDGRIKGYSYGATFLQSAERLVELGCHTVIGLDGGGSTTIAVTQPDATSARLLNRPSERTERYVSNQIFLIADSTPTGQLDHFFLRPEDNYVLGGSKVNLTVSGVDTNYIPMKADYQLSASAGTVSGAVFTAPAYGGDVTVTASGGGKTGSTVVHVVETPDSLQILNSEGGAVSALTVAPAGEVQLKASAAWNHADLFANPECFTWTVAGDMGTINDLGVFQARKPGSGTITVQAGGRTASIPVTVSRVPLWEAEDFEDYIPGAGTDASLSIAVGGELAKFGRGAGQLDYDLTAAGRAQWRAEKPFLTVGIPYEAVTLWVNGDGSGNTLSLLYRNGMGEETSLPICTLHFTGWRQAVVPLGYASFASITGFEVTAPGVQPTQASGDVDPWAPPADTALASLFDAGQAAEAELWTSDDGSGGAEAIDPSAIAAPDEETGATAESAAADIPAADANPADETAALMDAEAGADAETATEGSAAAEVETGTDDGTSTDSGIGMDSGTGTEDPNDTRKGRIWLDQMVATYDDLVDSTPPQVTVTLDETAWEVHATVRDTMDGILPYKSVSVSYNGRPVTDFAYDLNSGFVRYWLPSLTGDSRQPTRITVTAKDASGNIGRGSVDLEPYNTQHHFTDIEGCWAADYIDFLYDNNIASPLEDGKYLPYEPITRVQFAVMLARSVGLDGRNYADVVLPYADIDQIPENALPALKALWKENIMRGADGEDGQLYLYPNNSLTRAQASAMIGRSQKLGYAQAETLPFPDADTIPNYAVSHIQTMTARGILQGYQDGTFKPGAAISRGQMAKILYFLA